MAYKYIEWYPLAEGLRDFLKSYTYDDGRHLFEYLRSEDKELPIRVGAVNSGEYPAIVILFGEESGMNDRPKQQNGALVQLWIDIYLSGSDSSTEIDSSTELYKQMYNTEKELFIALEEYNNLMRKTLGIATNLQVIGILSDGDENIPVSMQHRIVIEIDWRK
jgi:hypothetical protein